MSLRQLAPGSRRDRQHVTSDSATATLGFPYRDRDSVETDVVCALQPFLNHVDFSSKTGPRPTLRRLHRGTYGSPPAAPPRIPLESPWLTDPRRQVSHLAAGWQGVTKRPASAVTGTATVYTRSPYSTSAGSTGGPPGLGRVAATSPKDCAFGLRVIAAEVCSRSPSRTATAPQPGGFGGDRSSEPGR